MPWRLSLCSKLPRLKGLKLRSESLYSHNCISLGCGVGKGSVYCLIPHYQLLIQPPCHPPQVYLLPVPSKSLHSSGLTPVLCSPAVTPLRCVTCHLHTQTDRCRRGFGICVAQEHERCMILKIFQGKLEGRGRCCEILRKFLRECFSNFLS